MPYRLRSLHKTHLFQRQLPSMECNSQISVGKGSFCRGRKYFLVREFTGNTVNSCHIKMTGNSFSIFRKDENWSQKGVKLLQGFPLPDMHENLKLYDKGGKLEIELTGLQLLKKASTSVSGLLLKNPFSWSFGLVCFHRPISSKFR